jgi:hypothetical protein
MAWVTTNGRRYYYHSYVANGMHRSTYIGTGPEAEAYAAAVQKRKAERTDRKRRRQELAKQILVAEQPLVAAHKAANATYVTWKIASGWYRHQCRWRKRGVTNMRTVRKSGGSDVLRAIESERAKREFDAGQVDVLVQKYNGDIAETALKCLLSIMTDDPYTREAYRASFQRVKDDLIGNDPTPIIAMAGHQLALSWMDASYWDAFFYTHAHGDNMTAIEHYDKRRARAARRLMRSIKVFAEICKTTIPEVNHRLSRFDLTKVVHAN